MMGRPPPADVIAALENGVTQTTRRVEIYENDAETRWYPLGEQNEETNRLTGGTVTVDYNSDERRKADITLLNDDFAFRLNPNGGFYYDKIIKLYRGVKYRAGSIRPKIALVESDWASPSSDFIAIRRAFAEMGYDLVDVTNATTYGQIAGYQIIAGMRNTSGMSKSNLMYEAWRQGAHVFTMAQGTTEFQIPHILSTANAAGENVSLSSVTNDHPLRGRIPETTANFFTGAGAKRITGVQTTAFVKDARVLAFNGNVPASLISTIGTNLEGTKWLNFQTVGTEISDPIVTQHVKVALDYMTTGFETEVTWEAQLGEFMIDAANDQIFPNQIKLTTRDYTKKLLKDKLTFTSSFPSGTPVKEFVRAIAANGGITKFRESIGPEVFPSEISYERSTERWKIIKEVCTAFDYECFFDSEGYLVVRKFNDPTLAPIYHTFQTGEQGNLVSFDRALNDSRIYNIINIYGDPINNDRLPYFGQAVNDDPSSPTSIMKLGNRPWDFSANYFSSDEECLALARSRLQIMALESYDINFTSIYYPWMEVGEIVRILDPHATGIDPTRFLMDTLSLSLGLGPMSGTGKRVTLVGSSG